MIELKGRQLQTLHFLLLTIFELVVAFLMQFKVINIDFIAFDMINVTIVFMILAQCLWLTKRERLAQIASVIYFVIMCIFLYYSLTITSIIVFAFNILIVANILAIRIKYKKKEDETNGK